MLFIMIVPLRIRKKKRGSRAGCPRKFQNLRLTFLKIDATDVAYKANFGRLVGWRKDLFDQCCSDGTGIIESRTTYICTAPQNQDMLQAVEMMRQAQVMVI